MLKSFALQLSISCPSCRQPMPINGVAEVALCKSCGNSHDLDQEFWTDRFGPDEFSEMLGFEEGEGRESTQLGGIEAKTTYGRRWARCGKCKTDIDPAQLPEAATQGGLTCSCGEWIRVREANDLARAMVPGARYLVHEGPIGSDATEPTPSDKPMMFACMSCGAGLKVDGSTRTVECEYCQASNYLPDGLWLRLHPPSTIKTFFLIAELDQPALDQLRYTPDSDACEQDAGREDLSPEAYMLIARAEDSDARARLALNSAVQVEVLELLAGDEDWDVRKHVAINPNTPAAVLVRLATDSDSDVREHVAMNPNTPVEALATLAGDSDSDVRERVAAHPSTPKQALDRLSRDSDSDVKKAARGRGGGAEQRAAEKVAEDQAAKRAMLLKIIVAIAVAGVLLVAFWLSR